MPEIPQDYIIQKMYVILELAANKATIGHNHTYRYRPTEITKKLPILFLDYAGGHRDVEDNWAEFSVDVFYVALGEEAQELYPKIRLALGNIEQILIDDTTLRVFAAPGVVESETAQAAISLGRPGEPEPTWYSGGVVRVTYRVLDLDQNRSDR